jgi:hypothetical protein
MRFAKIVFLVAGVYGLLVLAPLYFLESMIGRQTPPAITHPEYFYGFVGVGLAWQVLFLAVSRDPVRYRAMILPSVLEKVSYGIALAVLFSQHRLPLSYSSPPTSRQNPNAPPFDPNHIYISRESYKVLLYRH